MRPRSRPRARAGPPDRHNIAQRHPRTVPVMSLDQETWVLTGGAGRIATSARPGLAAAVGRLRLADVTAPEPTAANEESFSADLRDEAATAASIAGADGVVHLGAIPDENDF